MFRHLSAVVVAVAVAHARADAQQITLAGRVLEVELESRPLFQRVCPGCAVGTPIKIALNGGRAREQRECEGVPESSCPRDYRGSEVLVTVGSQSWTLTTGYAAFVSPPIDPQPGFGSELGVLDREGTPARASQPQSVISYDGPHVLVRKNLTRGDRSVIDGIKDEPVYQGPIGGPDVLIKFASCASDDLRSCRYVGLIRGRLGAVATGNTPPRGVAASSWCSSTTAAIREAKAEDVRAIVQRSPGCRAVAVQDACNYLPPTGSSMYETAITTGTPASVRAVSILRALRTGVVGPPLAGIPRQVLDDEIGRCAAEPLTRKIESTTRAQSSGTQPTAAPVSAAGRPAAPVIAPSAVPADQGARDASRTVHSPPASTASALPEREPSGIRTITDEPPGLSPRFFPAVVEGVRLSPERSERVPLERLADQGWVYHSRDRFVRLRLGRRGAFTEGLRVYVEAFPLDASGRDPNIRTDTLNGQIGRFYPPRGVFLLAEDHTLDAGPSQPNGTMWFVWVPQLQTGRPDDLRGVELFIDYNPKSRSRR